MQRKIYLEVAIFFEKLLDKYLLEDERKRFVSVIASLATGEAKEKLDDALNMLVERGLLDNEQVSALIFAVSTCETIKASIEKSIIKKEGLERSIKP